MGRIKYILAGVVCAVMTFVTIPRAVAAQTAYPEVAIPATQSRMMRSKIINRDYKISIALPEEYDGKSSKKYPVLFVLDANIYFATTVQSYRVQRIGNDVPPLVIVGIEYPTDNAESLPTRRSLISTKATPRPTVIR